MRTRKRFVRLTDGTVGLLVSDSLYDRPRPRHWWQRLVYLYEALDPLHGYINIHRPHPSLRLGGYARALVFFPRGWRMVWYWGRWQRWPRWEWEHFTKESMDEEPSAEAIT